MTPLLTRPMRDAAYAARIDPWKGTVAGYLGGPDAFRTWGKQEWALFPGQPKLPIWVGGQNGQADAWACLRALYDLGVPPGCPVVNDMETRVDRTYLTAFGAILHWAGFRVWVYGSASTVFSNPQLNGYWVADYAGKGPFMYSHPGVRATQYEAGPNYDSSLVKAWAVRRLWR